MNLRRAIFGPLLSIILLIFFAYIVSGVQWTLSSTPLGQSGKSLTGSISGGVENAVAPSPSVSPAQPAVAVSPPVIDAAAAISVESDLSSTNKIILDQSSDAVLPIASLTKLMTATIVLDNYSLSDPVLVDAVADSQDPLKQDLKLNDEMPVENFLDIMLISSSNKAAYALSELIGEGQFVGLMNQKAKAIGMQNTFFADPTGLSPKDVSTADDLAKLAEYILKYYPKISDISKETKLYVPGFGTIDNTDELLGEVPEAVCSKTGFTPEAKGCLLLVTSNPKNNDYLINIVLGADDRFSEMKKIINWSSAACN